MNRDEILLGSKTVKVRYCGEDVGTLALVNKYKVAFSYDSNWLKQGFSINPFSLPLEAKVFLPDRHYFDGLFGIFADSLPDAWGNLLLNRMLREHGMSKDLTVLDRLTLVGSSGMGALEYVPSYELADQKTIENYDYLSQEVKKVLQTEYSKDLDTLYKLGGSSGGARPKILTQVDGEDWIIKFASHLDPVDIGIQEYAYSLCAKKCGIDMPETRLFPTDICKGYFGIKRFDRQKGKKFHMATVASLLEADFRAPCLDYHTLMKLTKIITRDNEADLENMYRRMCFNVFAHNRDDHAKNFTFIYHEKEGTWRLSPAYDLTYSTTYFGEHTTSVDGNGSNPGKKEVMAVGMKAGMTKQKCATIADEIQTLVSSELKEYL